MLAKKPPVHITPCVNEHPFLSRGKISTTPDVASSRLAVAINGVLNGLCFVRKDYGPSFERKTGLFLKAVYTFSILIDK